jgi:transcriptional regulator with XRE-family HTH domain
MKTYQEHDCEESAIENISTPERPYHYVGSGLGNVFLVGVRYWICELCGKQSAEVPALNDLLSSIARTLVEKESRLTGEQVRYLRKRLGKASNQFAALIGVTPERYSGIESSQGPLSEGRDKLVRFVYRVFSGDRKLKDALADKRRIEQWLLALHGREHTESIVGTWVGNRRWRVQAEPSEFQGFAA